MSYLGKREQLMLCIVLSLLLAGWAVKAYLKAQPVTAIAAPAKR